MASSSSSQSKYSAENRAHLLIETGKRLAKFKGAGSPRKLSLLNKTLESYLNFILKSFEESPSRPEVDDSDYKVAATLLTKYQEMCATFKEQWGHSWAKYTVHHQHEVRVALSDYVNTVILVCEAGANLDMTMKAMYEAIMRPAQYKAVRQRELGIQKKEVGTSKDRKTLLELGELNKSVMVSDEVEITNHRDFIRKTVKEDSALVFTFSCAHGRICQFFSAQ